MQKRPIFIQRHEWIALALSFVYFFCVLAAYYMIRPVRDQLSAASGSIVLPLFYAATFAATLLLTPIFGALVARFPRKRFMPAVYVFFIVCLIGFIPLFQAQNTIGARTLGVIFFVWVSVFNLFVVSVFWSFMADIFDTEQSHRLFPIIAIGGSLGAVIGPVLTKVLVNPIGVTGLLPVSASLLGVALVCIGGLIVWSRRHPVAGDVRRDERIIGGSIIAGAMQTLRSPFLRQMAVLMLLGDCVGTVVYALLADHIQVVAATPELRTQMYATIDLWTNLIQIVFQATLTRWLMTRFGPLPTLVLPALLNTVLLIAVAVVGAPMIVVLAVLSRAGAYGILKPAMDSLYTRVDAEMRYKGKNFIDTVVWRFGDVTVTSIFNALRVVGTTLSGFALFTTVATVSAGWLGWRILRTSDLALQQREKSSL